MANNEPLQEPNTGWNEGLGANASNPESSRTVGDTIYSLICEHCNGDKCEECDMTGKGKWTLSECENRIKGQFESWVVNNQRKSIIALEEESANAIDQRERTRLSSEADSERETLQEFRSAGYYNWGGRYVRRALTDLPGLWHLFYLLLKRCHSKMTQEKAKEIFNGNQKDAMASMSWAQGNSSAPSSAEGKGSKVGPKESKTMENGKTMKSVTKVEERVVQRLPEPRKIEEPVTLD